MNRRRTILLALALGAVLIPPGALTSSGRAARPERAKLLDYFTHDDLERSRRYRAPAYALSFIGMGAGIVALLAIGLAPGVRHVGRAAIRVTGDRWWLQAILLAIVVVVITSLVDLPFSAARDRLDRAWGLSTRTTGGFIADFGRQAAFQAVLAIIVSTGLVGLARWLPRGWPVAAAAAAVVLTVGLSMLWPLVYEPLFNKFTPVEPLLRERIVELGRKAGVDVGSVVVADASRRTTRQNAYVSGLGATKRVVLYDTLLEKSAPREVDLVVAHELAHVAHSDVLRATIFGSAGAALIVVVISILMSSEALRGWLGVGGMADARSLPFLALVFTVASIVALPVGNAYSRRIESAADRTAVRTTRDADTAIAVEVALARDNISDLQPNGFVVWSFFSHPPVMVRIDIALEEQERLGR